MITFAHGDLTNYVFVFILQKRLDTVAILLQASHFLKMYFSQLIPCSTVFFSGIGGSNLDSHHGFIVEYGINRDVDIGKVTLDQNFFVFDVDLS